MLHRDREGERIMQAMMISNLVLVSLILVVLLVSQEPLAVGRVLA